MVEAPSTLVHHLLCAVPQLEDTNFKRRVVFMLDHDERGALGLVVNHVGASSIAEIATELGLRWRGDPRQRVRTGGPVEPSRGWILHDDPQWDPAAQRVMNGLWLTTSLDHVTRAGHQDTGAEPTRLIFALGYAGWGPDELEQEIAAGTWLPVPIGDAAGLPVQWLFDARPDGMWSEALEASGLAPGRILGLAAGRAGMA
jgi:putative transcriptional regulator